MTVDYSSDPNKCTTCMPYLILTKLPPYTLLFGPVVVLKIEILQAGSLILATVDQCWTRWTLFMANWIWSLYFITNNKVTWFSTTHCFPKNIILIQNLKENRSDAQKTSFDTFYISGTAWGTINLFTSFCTLFWRAFN